MSKLNNQLLFDNESRSKISEYLNTNRVKRQQKKRSVSNHVVSRYYRAPEVIILEKEYSQKIDMWSVGCVIAELLHCLEKQNKAKVSERHRVLFLGKSCYPLSPDKECMESQETDGQEELKIDSKD